MGIALIAMEQRHAEAIDEVRYYFHMGVAGLTPSSSKIRKFENF